MRNFRAEKTHIGVNTYNKDLLSGLKDFLDIKIIKKMNIEESGFSLWKIVWFSIDGLKDIVFELKIISDIENLKENQNPHPSFHIGLHVNNIEDIYERHKALQKEKKYSFSVKVDSIRLLDGFKYYYLIFDDKLLIQIIDDGDFLFNSKNK